MSFRGPKGANRWDIWRWRSFRCRGGYRRQRPSQSPKEARTNQNCPWQEPEG